MDFILRLALDGRSQNITLKLEDISKRLVKNVPDLLMCFTQIAISWCCHLLLIRPPAEAEMLRLGRGQLGAVAFSASIPVKSSNHWSSLKVLEPLCDTLSVPVGRRLRI